MFTENRIIYVMGVAGCGKSTVGSALAEKTGLPFYDGDDFHPDSNIEKMSSGKPLNDKDRKEWLHKLQQLAEQEIQNKGAIIATSALKEFYRQILMDGLDRDHVTWIFLDGEYDLILSRMKDRDDHFMPEDLLQSQFDTLEKPVYGLRINIDQPVDRIISKLLSVFNHGD